jgi:type IX secretion system PorP/SprF family membrane protein
MKNRRLILIAKRYLLRGEGGVSLLLVCFALLGSQPYLAAQQLPIHSQYFLNPYVYNPAFVGNQGYTEVFFTHRRQWIEIEGAPVTTALSVHLPTRSRIAFGANLYATRQGLLHTTGGLFTAGYSLQLSHNQYLRAGISAGFRSTGIDQSRINATNAGDLAFSSDYNNQVGLDANVGLNYQMAGLTLGAALTNPFKRANSLNEGSNKARVSPLDQFMVSAAYRIELEGAVIEPQLLYGKQAGDQARMEALATVLLRELVWVGGAYRNGYGASFLAGVRLGEVARIGYAYELASQQVDGLGRGSHELLLSYRFGEKKESGPSNGRRRTKGDDFKDRYLRQQKKAYDKASKQKREAAKKLAQEKAAARATNPSASSAPSDSLQRGKKGPVSGSRPGGAKKIQPAKPSLSPAGDAKGSKAGRERTGKLGTTSFKDFLDQPKDGSKPIVTPKGEDLKASDENFEKVLRSVSADASNPESMPKGYYVIVGTFEHKENAQRFSKELSTKGFPQATYKLNPESKYYHVYTLSTQTLEEARKEWAKLRQQPGFGDTWVNVLQVE